MWWSRQRFVLCSMATSAFLSLRVQISCFSLQLVEMGFAEVRAKKGLMFGAGPDMESAVNWLMDHQARVAGSVDSIVHFMRGITHKGARKWDV